MFFVLFVFSGLAAVFFTWRYVGRSWVQLLLGYLGAVAFATGVTGSFLGFSRVVSVWLAVGVSAALTGFGLGVYVLELLVSSSGGGSAQGGTEEDMESDDPVLYEDKMVRETVRVEEK